MRDFGQRLKDAMESLDAERLKGLFSSEFHVTTETLSTTMKVDEMDALLRAALDTIDGLDMDVRKTVQRGNEVALLLHVDVAFKSDYQLGDISIPSAGKTIHLDAAVFATLDEEGRIKEMVRVRDNWALMRDLGLGADDMRDLQTRAERMFEQGERAGAKRATPG